VAVSPAALAASRRRVLIDAMGIAVSAIGFGFVYGLSAREAGFSPIEVLAMSVLVFGGASQFAAVGYVASGLAWPGIVLLTALLNARHLLYSAALAPWLSKVPFGRRAVMAHLLTDEAFAISIGHFRRLGSTDAWGYWMGAIVSTFIPWTLASVAGVFLGGQIPDPARLGIDIIFPAAMIGLSVGLLTGRREVVAANPTLFNFPTEMQFVPSPSRRSSTLMVASDQEYRLAAINAGISSDMLQPPFVVTEVTIPR